MGVNFLNQIDPALFAELDLEAFVGEQNRFSDGNVVDWDDIDDPANASAHVCVQFGFFVVQGFDLLDEVAHNKSARNLL